MHTDTDILPFGNLLAINKGPRSFTVPTKKGYTIPLIAVLTKNNVGTERKNTLRFLYHFIKFKDIQFGHIKFRIVYSISLILIEY